MPVVEVLALGGDLADDMLVIAIPHQTMTTMMTTVRAGAAVAVGQEGVGLGMTAEAEAAEVAEVDAVAPSEITATPLRVLTRLRSTLGVSR